MAHGARRLAADPSAALALAAWFHVPVPTASAEEGHYHVACAAVIARHHIQGEARPDPDAASAAVARWAMAVRAGQDPHQAFLQAFSRSPAGGPAVI
jgi:hypothetical protein